LSGGEKTFGIKEIEAYSVTIEWFWKIKFAF
jgi:hypothetical protein